MEFFGEAINMLQILVIALGAGLAVWGVINLLADYYLLETRTAEGYRLPEGGFSFALTEHGAVVELPIQNQKEPEPGAIKIIKKAEDVGTLLSGAVFGVYDAATDTKVAELTTHKEAKKAFDALGLKKIPSIKALQQEYAALLAEKKKLYASYNKAKKEMRDILTAKNNVDRLLRYSDAERGRENERPQV